MKVLIVESEPNLRRIWAAHLRRSGYTVIEADSQGSAVECLQVNQIEMIVANLVLDGGSGLAVADYASYRHPDAKVIFVNRSGFFSDGSIFEHTANVCTMIPGRSEPEDLGAVVEHYAMH